jgi:hypothetical protein
MKSKIRDEQYDKSMSPICNKCKHYLGNVKCKAFDKIIDDVLFGRNNHNKVIKGQKGKYVFEQK